MSAHAVVRWGCRLLSGQTWGGGISGQLCALVGGPCHNTAALQLVQRASNTSIHIAAWTGPLGEGICLPTFSLLCLSLPLNAAFQLIPPLSLPLPVLLSLLPPLSVHLSASLSPLQRCCHSNQTVEAIFQPVALWIRPAEHRECDRDIRGNVFSWKICCNFQNSCFV